MHKCNKDVQRLLKHPQGLGFESEFKISSFHEKLFGRFIDHPTQPKNLKRPI